jgi:hypothetical protein
VRLNRLYLDVSARRGCQPRADGEAEPMRPAVRFRQDGPTGGGGERLSDGPVVRLEGFVLDADDQLSVRVVGCDQAHGPTVGHRLDSVRNEVEQHPIQELRVASSRRRRFVRHGQLDLVIFQ